jgi:hypothetical protein
LWRKRRAVRRWGNFSRLRCDRTKLKRWRAGHHANREASCSVGTRPSGVR